MYACAGLEGAAGDLDAPDARGLPEASIDADHEWTVVKGINGRKRFLQIDGMDGLVQRAVKMEPGAFVAGEGRADQRAQAIPGRAVRADADDHDRLLFFGLGQIKQKTMNDSGMDFRIGMWYF